ncbi:MAG: hypothetical protein V3V78_04420 [Candidatus Woesearchaeota archaeon]
MSPEEKKEVEKITKVFSKIKKDNKLTTAETDDFMSDITKLIGMYGAHKREKISVLIEEMLVFGDNNLLAVDGLRLEFKKAKQL